MTTDLAPDWILKQALESQRKANAAWVSGKPEIDDGGLTLTILGCGIMGIAFLKGLLRRRNQDAATDSRMVESFPSATCEMPAKVPTRFNACVRRPESAKKVRTELEQFNARLQIFENKNVEAVQAANIILLSCKPQDAKEILLAFGMQEALSGKLLISICEGLPEVEIKDILYTQNSGFEKCTIVRATPNIAATIGESMTIVGISTPALDTGTHDLVAWIFAQLGRVFFLPSSKMDVVSALCSSGPAFVALMTESFASSAIASGLPRQEAYLLASQIFRGTGTMLLQGEHPALLRDRVSTPGGSTAAGLDVLEEAAVRNTIREAIRRTAATATCRHPSKKPDS